MTLGERLHAAHGHPSGFDVLRLALAAGVIVQHSINVTEGQEAAVRFFHSQWRGLFEPILPMFFALSGFLVAGSLFRCRSLVGFCGLRTLRIVPALAVEVVLSALLLGPVVTTLPLTDYFCSGSLWAYFLNVVGDIHYHLPGVFAGNPDPNTVNAQLWTVPYELECYLVLAAAALAGLSRRPTRFVALVGAIQLVFLALFVFSPAGELEITVPGRMLVFCFLTGVATFLLRASIPYRRDLAVTALVAAELLIWIPGGSLLLAMPVTYLTVVIGLAELPKAPWLFDGDYSYGLYLYGFPIQQALVHIAPSLPWFVDAPAALAIAFGAARLSWWLFERRALGFRPALHRLENGVLDRLPSRLMPMLTSRLAEASEALSPTTAEVRQASRLGETN